MNKSIALYVVASHPMLYLPIHLRFDIRIYCIELWHRRWSQRQAFDSSNEPHVKNSDTLQWEISILNGFAMAGCRR